MDQWQLPCPLEPKTGRPTQGLRWRCDKIAGTFRMQRGTHWLIPLDSHGHAVRGESGLGEDLGSDLTAAVSRPIQCRRCKGTFTIADSIAWGKDRPAARLVALRKHNADG